MDETVLPAVAVPVQRQMSLRPGTRHRAAAALTVGPSALEGLLRAPVE